jgi:hypothetical protein
VLQSSQSLHTDSLHCQLYHAFFQTLHTHTCHYLKLGHDHFILQAYDSYRTGHPTTFYLSSEQMTVLLNTSYTNIWSHFQKQKTLFRICVSLILSPVTFLLQITISIFLQFLSQFPFPTRTVTLNALCTLSQFYLPLHLRQSDDTYILSVTATFHCAEGCQATKLRLN